MSLIVQKKISMNDFQVCGGEMNILPYGENAGEELSLPPPSPDSMSLHD